MSGSVLIKCLQTVGGIAYAGCTIHVVTNYVAEPTLVTIFYCLSGVLNGMGIAFTS